MNIVVDTNILLSILLKPTGITSALFYKLSKIKKLYIPTFALDELQKHHQKIVKYSPLTEDEIFEFKKYFTTALILIREEDILNTTASKAYQLSKNIDINGTIFIATALHVNGILWSGDKKLKLGLLFQGENLVYNNSDIQTQIL
jgi:predicted nucleic acid-binding protein